MNIEYRFLQKAIEKRNYVSFSYENKKYENIKAISLIDNTLTTHRGTFLFNKLKKIQILKQRY